MKMPVLNLQEEHKQSNTLISLKIAGKKTMPLCEIPLTIIFINS